ncbi:hypothetical protein ACRAKI_22215 [Saccharothrix isguenensis]
MTDAVGGRLVKYALETFHGGFAVPGVGEAEAAVDPGRAGLRGGVIEEPQELPLSAVGGVGVLVLGAAQSGHGLPGVPEIGVVQRFVQRDASR